MAGWIRRLPPQMRGRAMARALTAPRTIMVSGAVAAGAVAAGLPALAIGGLAALGYGLASIFTVARPRDLARIIFPDLDIDLSRLDPEGTRQVGDALAARQAFRNAVAHCPPGPFRDRFSDMSDDVDKAIEELYKLVLRAQSLRGYLTRNPPRRLTEQLNRAQAAHRATHKGSPLRAQVGAQVEALEEQKAARERLEVAHAAAVAKIGATTARIDQLAAQLTEVVLLSDDRAADATLPGARSDVARLVDELNSVRHALDDMADLPLAAPSESRRAAEPQLE